VNDQLRAMEIEAGLLNLGRVVFHIHMAQVHPKYQTYHLMEALELADGDYFGQDLANRLRDIVYGAVRKAVAA